MSCSPVTTISTNGSPRSVGRAHPTPAGVREFVVGTGGRSLYPIVRVHAGSEVRRPATFGVLFLTLDRGGYGWQFVDESGRIDDEGTSTCR
jgi:hypothetical protein